jgi:CheY-like chemotaxis protein
MARDTSRSGASRTRKRARRKAVHPERARKPRQKAEPNGETALAMFAHEIRTALTGILALGELLASAELGSREREWAGALKGTAEHLSALSTLVVEAARAKANRLELRRDAFDLGLFVEAIAASLTARAVAKGLTPSVSIAVGLPQRVRGDVVRLRAALENLIDNAAKFTDKGSVGLEVTAEAAPRQQVRLSFVVSDTGPGLDAAAIKRLFRPYAQASADVARLYGGAGLGLVSVRRIAQAMHGSLAMTSTPGAGSRLRLDVLLPRAAASAAPRKAGEQRAAPRRLRLLCAEDNPFGRVILDTILRELGHTVSFAANGEAVVESVARDSYDAVLMDVALPTLDGLAAARRIRELPGAAGRVPIIGISGRSEPNDEAAARAAGMELYLRKPVSPRVLAAALAKVVGGGSDQSDR